MANQPVTRAMEEQSKKSLRTKSVPAKRRTMTTRPEEAEQRLALILEATTEGYWDWKVRSGEVDYGHGWLSSLG